MAIAINLNELAIPLILHGSDIKMELNCVYSKSCFGSLQMKSAMSDNDSLKRNAAMNEDKKPAPVKRPKTSSDTLAHRIPQKRC